MGCDIHAFLERKKSTENEWSLDTCHTINANAEIRELTLGRWYELFGKMANVRCSNYGNKRALGIPKNASQKYKDICHDWGVDSHSHSWMSIEQYEKILNKLGYLKDIDIPTHKWRHPTCNWQDVVDNMCMFAIVLCYVYDQIENNNALYIITNDPYYLNEKFRLVFFFDS